jgi:tocopherol O-methyltransferase
MNEGQGSALQQRRRIVDYYDRCWGERIRAGHNQRSGAIHYGLYFSGEEDAETAKLRTNAELAALAALGAGPLHVLDAGCGVGGTAVDLALRYPELELVGITLSADQVELATQHAARAGVGSRVGFFVRDYHDTGFAAASFDVVWAIESLCHTPDRRGFFREVARLLRPGGQLIVADFLRTELPIEAWRAEYTALCEGFAIHDYYDEPLTAIAAELGWTIAQAVDLTSNVLPAVERSAAKARLQLQADGLTAAMRGHLQACAVLAPLCSAGLLCYRHWRFEAPRT